LSKKKTKGRIAICGIDYEDDKGNVWELSWLWLMDIIKYRQKKHFQLTASDRCAHPCRSRHRARVGSDNPDPEQQSQNHQRVEYSQGK
jgi:hypothetical protein